MLFHVWHVQKNGIVVACGAIQPQGLIHPAFARKLDRSLLCAKCQEALKVYDPILVDKPQKATAAAAC